MSKNNFLKSFVITFLLVFGVGLLNSFGQGKEAKLKMLNELADEFYQNKQYAQALPTYLEIDTLDPGVGDHHYRIGVCYLHSVESKKALPYLELGQKEGNVPDEIYYYMGVAQHKNHLLDEAIENFKTAKTKIGTFSDLVKVTEKEIDREIASCEYAKYQISHPLDYEITNAGDNVNSSAPDYVPVVSADESMLIFTTRRENVKGNKLDFFDELPMEDIFVCYRDKEGDEWSPAESLADNINTKWHDAAVSISADGKTLLMYRSDEKGSSKHESGNIYKSSFDGENWSDPEILPEPINSEDWEPSASLMSHENVLFFSSNRPGGKGGKDIYMSKRLPNGDWGEPVNLEGINTEFDEDAPFVHSDNRTLYFASKGHKSMGGFDIFMSMMDDDGNWTTPQNIGYPINTTDDDIYFVWAGDGKNGYLASIRDDSRGDKDIYVVKRLVETKSFLVLKGTVLDYETNEPVAGIIKLFDEAEHMAGFFTSDGSNGKFTAIIPAEQGFKLMTSAEGYDSAENIIQTPEAENYTEMEYTIFLNKTQVQDTTTADSSASDSATTEPVGPTGPVAGDFKIKDIYFDFDKSNLKDPSVNELANIIKIMKAYPDNALKLKITGHTDSKGSDAYNMKLSKKRANVAADYVVKNGVDRGRLIVDYKGESVPVAPNTKPDGSDNPEGRALNRRTEFRFVDTTK